MLPKYVLIALLCFSSVEVERGVPFAERGKEVLRMDLYAAEDVDAPWLVFAHGGGFSAGRRDVPQVVAFAEGLAERGVSVAAISYRLRQVGAGFGCDVPVDDKREAIAWAAEDLGAACAALTHRGARWLAVGGSSAGAEAALHWAVRQPVGAVVSFSGAVEPGGALHPPLFALHGTCDAVVPFDESVHRGCERDAPGAFMLQGGGALQKCWEQAGSPAVVWAFEGAGHEVCNSAMLDEEALDAVAAFILAASAGSTPDSEFRSIGAPAPCSREPYFPCD